MRRFLALFCFFFLSFWPVFGENVWDQLAASISIFPSQQSRASDPADTVKQLKNQQSEIISLINIEKARIFEEVRKKKEIQSLVADIQSSLSDIALHLSQKSLIPASEDFLIREMEIKIQEKESVVTKNILTLSAILNQDPYPALVWFEKLQTDFPSLKDMAQKRIEVLDKNIIAAEKKRQDFIEQKNEELAEISLTIKHVQELRSHQLSETIQQLSWYLLIFAFIYFLRVVSRSFLSRFGRGFSKGHQEVLFLIHKWLFYILFFATLLMIFSVEFISFLPFLAILTTAIGFSLREVISSFIWWFVIEADSWYKVGDLIELDIMTGRVKSVTPLLTNIEEYGLQGFTGKIISFPNKTIFEKSIKNWSHGSDFLMISNDFLLTYESDINAAKELLMEVVGYNALPQYYTSRREINLFKTIYNFTDDDLKTQIHVLTDNKGIILRVRSLVHMRDRFSEQSRIVETFISRVQKEKHIAMWKI